MVSSPVRPSGDPPSDWRGIRVLVTGAAGFLGSNLCRTLIECGADVIAIDGFVAGTGMNRSSVDWPDAHVQAADLCTADLKPICRGVDYVFNLAAQTGHMNGQADPKRDLETNAVAQLRLIEAVRTHAAEAVVVHTSTRQVYGVPQRLPVDEDHPIDPPDANSVSKLAGEQYWLLEHRLYQRAAVVLRLTNCYGPRQHIRDAGQSFIGSWIGQVLQGRPFAVWDGTQRRDMLYVDDAVSALLQAAAATTPKGVAYNVGGAPAVTLLQLAQLLTDTVPACPGFTVRPMPKDRALIDIGSFVTDDRRFRAAANWSPRTSLSDGLAATVAWFRPRLAAYV